MKNIAGLLHQRDIAETLVVAHLSQFVIPVSEHKCEGKAQPGGTELSSYICTSINNTVMAGEIVFMGEHVVRVHVICATS